MAKKKRSDADIVRKSPKSAGKKVVRKATHRVIDRMLGRKK